MYFQTVQAASQAETQKQNSKQNNTINALGKDEFLKLLITQLKYQDPISPVDDKEFIAQLAQFSSLEQMQNLNQTIGQMMESQQRLTALGQATSLLGRTVEIYSKEGESLFGEVTGVYFKDGWPHLIVDGKPYDFTEIVGILEVGDKSGK
ncbi:MAG: flagellar hook assembly protein FlgD [Firmicutes bacterium]|nr:flagellar hook assembly protein FlgD [Bacillota bacterium]